MKWVDRLKKKKEKLSKKAEEMKLRGLERTEQSRAEKLRKKQQRAKYVEPGTFRYGMMHKQNPLDFMKDVKERRKQKKEEKH